MTRHFCLLAFLAIVLVGCTDETPPHVEENEWRAATQTDSTGAIQGAFLARDAMGDPLERQHFPPTLLLRCGNGNAAVYINWKSDLGRDTATVQLSFDDEPERAELWLASSDHEAAGRWTDSLAVPLLREMMGHTQMRVTTETGTGLQTWVFPLDGLDNASAPLRDACEL